MAKKQQVDRPDPWIPRWGKHNEFFENSTLKRETIKLQGGGKLTVYEENHVAAEYVRELEKDCKENPIPDLRRQIFRETFYSKLVACSTGDVPTDEEARYMPTKDLNNWITAHRRLNPNWWIPLEKALDQMDEAEKKRKSRKIPKSGNG